jgi:tetratricopeptide (TPR) repeat protein
MMNTLNNMKIIVLTLILSVSGFFYSGFSQTNPDNSKIDILLIHGNNKKVIDTCQQILTTDTLNSETYYKMGLAYQNLLYDDRALDCFLKAATISPDNNNYNFMVAKIYFTKGKTNKALPILEKLCEIDTMNWAYAYYLTTIYLQKEKYDESIKIFNRFYKQDSSNYVFMDKIGFANLRKGESDKAMVMFNKSLAINPKNINAIKNLSYLYASTFSVDTATRLLTKGIRIDPTDMDMYARRAALNYSIYSFKKALDDYLRIINSGDSSALYLKRAGIAYANTGRSDEAVRFLGKAFERDTLDFEIVSNLAVNYAILKDYKNSIYYYKFVLKRLTPAIAQLGLNYLLLASVLKSDNQYIEAIEAYLKSQEFRSDNSVYMNIANLYDEKLKDTHKAIHYYEVYLDKQSKSKDNYATDYTESIKQRIEYLKKTNSN